MYEAKAAMFLYCVSPVHMGTGAALGVVDDPIQRERHNQHPMLAGTGIHGAIRHHLVAAGERGPGRPWVEMAFGRADAASPEPAGAISFSDALLVAFPVRSPRHSFVWVSSPATLARVKRLCTLCNVEGAAAWQIPEPGSGRALVGDASLLLEKRLLLEAFEFEASKWAPLGTTAEALSRIAFPRGPAFAFFRKKFAQHLVVVSEAELDHFVQNSVLVEPRLRLSRDSGAAGRGQISYSESIPPEACFLSLAMASGDRRMESGEQTSGRDMLHVLVEGNDGPGLQGTMVQVGRDVAGGRGQVVLSFAGEEVGDA